MEWIEEENAFVPHQPKTVGARRILRMDAWSRTTAVGFEKSDAGE